MQHQLVPGDEDLYSIKRCGFKHVMYLWPLIRLSEAVSAHLGVRVTSIVDHHIGARVFDGFSAASWTLQFWKYIKWD